MKTITEEIAALVKHGRKWLKINVEFCKLTAAEKLSIFASAAVAGTICLALMVICLTLLSLCLVELFRPLVGGPLAYCIVAAIYILIMVVVFLLRQQLIGNAVARFITRLLLDKPASEKEPEKKEE